jgi:preprotein translocase subunit SecG
MLSTVLTVLHVIVAFTMIVVVLFQQGKGASIGASFGGSSQTLFGPRGPATALAKITTISAVLFMITSLSLASLSNERRASSVSAPTTAEDMTLPTELPDLAPPADSAVPAAMEDFGGPVEDTSAGTDASTAADAPVAPVGGTPETQTGGPVAVPSDK